mgnify:CR=1 FL=1
MGPNKHTIMYVDPSLEGALLLCAKHALYENNACMYVAPS